MYQIRTVNANVYLITVVSSVVGLLRVTSKVHLSDTIHNRILL